MYELLGFHFGMESVAADESFAVEIERMAPLFEAAARKWFSMSKVVTGFARSLSRPGYSRIICQGIQWLFQAMPSSDDYDFWWDREMEGNLVNALHRCLETHSETVRTNKQVQSAFLGLLTALSSRGNHSAMSLKDSLLNSIANDR